MDGPQVESVGDPGSGWPHVYHHHFHPSRYHGLCPHPPLLPRPLVSFSGVRASLGLGCTRGEEFRRQGQGPGGGLATLPVADGSFHQTCLWWSLCWLWWGSLPWRLDLPSSTWTLLSSSPLSSGKGGGCNPDSSAPKTLILTIPPLPSLVFPTELTGLALGQQGWMGSRAG